MPNTFCRIIHIVPYLILRDSLKGRSCSGLAESHLPSAQSRDVEVLSPEGTGASFFCPSPPAKSLFTQGNDLETAILKMGGRGPGSGGSRRSAGLSHELQEEMDL